MRSVPHRVVFLLGLDDQAFPRHSYVDGDNVLTRRPMVGERDARSEDRQLFLDAILAAEEHLVVLYSGHDERTGAERPPAVPLGELLDVLDRTAEVPGGRVRDQVLTQHPLQPFDPRNFESGKLVRGRPFSFDPAAVLGGRAMTGQRTGRPEFLSKPLPADDGVVTLDELARFLEHPVKAFLRRRLGLTFVADDTDPADALTVDLDGLSGWQVGNRLLRAGLAGADHTAAVAAELARGDLPPGQLGRAALEPILTSVVSLVDRSSSLRSGSPTSIDVDVTLPTGTRLLGTVANVYGDCAVRIEYSKLKPKHRLVGWLNALALTASGPETSWRSMVAGRGERTDIAYSHVAGLTHDRAVTELEHLVALYRLGMTQPLPLTAEASAAYAERRDKGAPDFDAVDKARSAWRRTGANGSWGEFSDAAHLCVWGEAELDVLLSEPGDDEPTRFGSLAMRLWQPLLSVEARG